MRIEKDGKDYQLFRATFGRPDNVKYRGVGAHRYNGLENLDKLIQKFNSASSEVEAKKIEKNFFTLHFRT